MRNTARALGLALAAATRTRGTAVASSFGRRWCPVAKGDGRLITRPPYGEDNLMPAPPPITETQLRGLNQTVMLQGGVLQNCIVHRSPACHERGGYFIGYPLPTGGWPAAGAHVCGDCALVLRDGDATNAQTDEREAGDD